MSNVDFRLHKLGISNFRGIRQADLEFHQGASTYLIGANNAGKSTMVNALALALRGGGMHLFKPDPYDFFHDSSGTRSPTFSLALRFAANSTGGLPAVQGVGNPTYVHAISVDGLTDKKGNLSHRHRLLDEHGKAITFSQRTSVKGKTKDEFAGQDVGWKPVNARLSDIYQSLPDLWLLTPDNLYKSLYEWKTGPLHRLSKMLTEQFLDISWEMEYGDKKRAMPDTIHTMHEFFRSAVTAFPFWKDDLKPKLEESLSAYIGKQARIALQPDLQTIEDWLTQQLQASFAADAGGPLTPLDRMGHGWQSLVRLAALDVISQYPDQVREKVVLLFEEPETYLHPHLRRKLRRVLDRLAGQGWYVVCATHAPEFVSFASKQVVTRLWRDGDDVHTGSIHTSAVTDEAKFQEKLDEYGNHEMLFCNRVVLCEGKDDMFAARTYLEKVGVDLDGRSVTVLGVGGIGNLPEYARIAGELCIPWFAITDEDPQPGGQIKPATKEVRDQLAALAKAGDRSEIWPVDLESCLGLTGGQKARPDWQRLNIEPKALSALESGYPDFCAVGVSIKAWLDSTPSSSTA